MTWTPWLTTLSDVLADLYPTIEKSRAVVVCAGVPRHAFTFDRSPVVNWYNILDSVRDSVPFQQAILRCALRDHPTHKLLRALSSDEPTPVKGPEPSWDSPIDARTLEKITGTQNTLLPIRFLEIGVRASRSVARVVRTDRSSGTGFLIGGSWFLTNNHVLPTKSIAAEAVVEFNYQLTADGLDAPVSKYSLNADRFETSVENDWTAVGIDARAEDEWGFIPLEPVGAPVGSFVNIIQHPGGGPKQIALFHNTVAFEGNGRLQYLTDTLPGSSGSPVFNEQWRVVALHHSGGMLREPGTKLSFYRNEGIAVTRIVEGLRGCGVLAGGE
ncbi:MAG TPA: trypsin-like peptidase domain-containing protein [Thermoanaerobaculia bacterium]|nr:trypsin-like peptidase domain-containing protein [Thermoanaerobaculia bacterium]